MGPFNMFGGPRNGGAGMPGRFEAVYRCYPVAFIRRDELEFGGKSMTLGAAMPC
jgi:hypothetical protein